MAEPRVAVRNTADPEQVASGALNERIGREDFLKNLSQLLDTEGGRAIIWRYVKEAGIYDECFTGNSETYFLLGKRSLGLLIRADVMEANAGAFVKMQAEAQRREAQ